VRKCGRCGSSKLRRVHRRFLERFRYLAIYECAACENEESVPRRYTYHLGEHARCPKCGTYRVTKLKSLDKIDKMFSGPLNLFEKLSHGQLHHCCFCRIQFYDRRRLAPRINVQPYGSRGEIADAEVIEPELIEHEAMDPPGRASADA
jgi:DNA-directed RNA polymerase subunit RPC12/RpoP